MANREGASITSEGPRYSLRRRVVVVPMALGFGVAAVFAVLALTHFDIDLGEIWTRIHSGSPGHYALAFVLYYLTFPLRGLRWRLLLQHGGVYAPGQRPPVLEHGLLLLISWMVNAVTWFRLGDAYRAYLASVRHKVSFAKVLGSILAERVMDIVVVLPLLALAGLGLIGGEAGRTAEAVMGAAAALAALAAMTILAMRLFGLRAARFLPARVEGEYVRLHTATLGSFKGVPALVALSAAIWLLEAGRLFFVIRALGFEVGLALVLFAALANSMLTAIPLTPGGIGFVEVGLTSLLVLALPRTDAAAATLVDRSITYLSVLVLGAVAFLGYHWAHARKRSPAPSLPPSAGEG